MKKEFNFKKAKKVGGKFKDKQVKVTVTSRLDPDIVQWLRDESEKKSIPYQTLMNSLLRQAMSGFMGDIATLRKVIRDELNRKKVG